MGRLVLGIGLLTLIVGACSGGPTGTVQQTAPAAPSSTPDYGRQYLAIADRWNPQVTAASSQFQATGNDPTKLKAALAAFATAEHGYSADVMKASWGPFANRAAAAATAAAKVAADARAILGSSDLTQATVVRKLLSDLTDEAAAISDLRAALGLRSAS